MCYSREAVGDFSSSESMFYNQNQNVVRKATTSKLEREREWTPPTMTQQPFTAEHVTCAAFPCASPTVTNIGRQAQWLLTEGEELKFREVKFPRFTLPVV